MRCGDSPRTSRARPPPSSEPFVKGPNRCADARVRRWVYEMHRYSTTMTSPPLPSQSIETVAERKNLLVPDLSRWPLDASQPVIELVDVSVAVGSKKVLNGLKDRKSVV